jgi:uncharacterized membrane protein
MVDLELLESRESPMISLLLAAFFFVGVHLFVSGTGLRQTLVDKIGEKPYLGLFSLLSLLGMVWLCSSYAALTTTNGWWHPEPARHAVALLMLLAFQLVTIGLTTPSPTVAGGEELLNQDQPAKGIVRVTRHPFLWGVALWALAHLLINGDAPSVVFFGAFLVLALMGPFAIDAKRKKKHGELWDGFAAVTSNLPFAAIVSGRNTLRIGEIGWWRIVLGLVLYGVFRFAHEWAFGLPV